MRKIEGIDSNGRTRIGVQGTNKKANKRIRPITNRELVIAIHSSPRVLRNGVTVSYRTTGLGEALKDTNSIFQPLGTVIITDGGSISRKLLGSLQRSPPGPSRKQEPCARLLLGPPIRKGNRLK